MRRVVKLNSPPPQEKLPLKSLALSGSKRRTCYKNADEPTCIDLILTNCPGSFQNSCFIETGLSDFHNIIITVVKPAYRKTEPKVINYRDCELLR